MSMKKSLLGLMAMAAMMETPFAQSSEPMSFNKRPTPTFSTGAYSGNRRYLRRKTNCTYKVIAKRRKANKVARKQRNINHR